MPPKTTPAPAAAAKGAAGGGSSSVSRKDRDDVVAKPDQAAYQAEQDAIRAEIEGVQAQVNDIKAKIALATNAPSAGAESGSGSRRQELKHELDGLRGQQADAKAKRGKLLDELKRVRDDVQKKIKDLQASKSKHAFRSVEEVDAQIKALEKQVESGSMTIANEKRALSEITALKRSRKNVDAFGDIQSAIDADKVRADALSAQLDDPALKAVGERFDAIKAELAELQKEGDVLYNQRNALFEQRRELSALLDKAHSRRKESSSKYKEAQDLYWTKVTEERARKAERFKADRKAADDAKRLETATRLLDDAKVPAYETEIQDCTTIINFLSGSSTAVPGGGAGPSSVSSSSSAPLYERKKIEGVEKLEGRKVAVGPEEGLVVRKKKGEDDDEMLFGGGGGKKKGSGGAPNQAKKAGSGLSTPKTAATPPPEREKTTDTRLNLPFAILSSILALSIPPPVSSADVGRTVDNLQTKKTWFQANQAAQTKANIAKAEKEIARLEGKQSAADAEDEPAERQTNGVREPAPTPGGGAAEATNGGSGSGSAERKASLPVEPTISEEADPEGADEVKELDEELEEVADEEKKEEEEEEDKQQKDEGEGESA